MKLLTSALILALATTQVAQFCSRTSFRCDSATRVSSCLMTYSDGRGGCLPNFNSPSDPCYVYSASSGRCLWCKPDNYYLDNTSGQCRSLGSSKINGCGNQYYDSSYGMQCNRCIRGVPNRSLTACQSMGGSSSYQCLVGWRNRGSQSEHCYICADGYWAQSKEQCSSTPSAFRGCNRYAYLGGRPFCVMCNSFLSYYHDGRGGCTK